MADLATLRTTVRRAKVAKNSDRNDNYGEIHGEVGGARAGQGRRRAGVGACSRHPGRSFGSRRLLPVHSRGLAPGGGTVRSGAPEGGGMPICSSAPPLCSRAPVTGKRVLHLSGTHRRSIRDRPSRRGALRERCLAPALRRVAHMSGTCLEIPDVIRRAERSLRNAAVIDNPLSLSPFRLRPGTPRDAFRSTMREDAVSAREAERRT